MIKWLVLLLGIFLARSSLACSSCGSGSGDPLVLYPNEARKMLLSLGLESGFKDITRTGEVARSFGLDHRQTLLLSVGQRISADSFVTVVAPLVTNHKGDRSVTGFGDLQVSGRYTLQRQTLVRPLIPQVQLLGGLVYSTARGTHESRDPDFLDATGSGFHQLFLGGDLWWAMTAFVCGLSYTENHALEEETAFGRQKRGAMRTANVTVGYTTSVWKIITGIVRQTIAPREIDGELQRGEDTISHQLFLTTEGKIGDAQTLRLTLLRKGYDFEQKNTNQDTNVTLAWMTAL